MQWWMQVLTSPVKLDISSLCLSNYQVHFWLKVKTCSVIGDILDLCFKYSSIILSQQRISYHVSTHWPDTPQPTYFIYHACKPIYCTKIHDVCVAICKSLTAWNPIHSAEHSSSECPHSIESLKCDQIPTWFTKDNHLRSCIRYANALPAVIIFILTLFVFIMSNVSIDSFVNYKWICRRR